MIMIHSFKMSGNQAGHTFVVEHNAKIEHGRARLRKIVDEISIKEVGQKEAPNYMKFIVDNDKNDVMSIAAKIYFWVNGGDSDKPTEDDKTNIDRIHAILQIMLGNL